MIRHVTITTALLATGIVSLFSTTVQAQNRMGRVSAADRKFAIEAAHGGIAEVRLGELAEQNGSSQFVKRFGHRMVEDHGKANDDLQTVASNLGITLPTDPNGEQRELMARLRRLHGAAFDSAYIRAMKMDHQMDIAAFKKEANMGKDASIRRFASRTLPIVQSHYRMLMDRKRM
ncbi:MAG: outer membrane protein [Chthonomonadales bacterium]|nr:outer membrane protein [Chthonomonadales bacterium]